MVGLPAHFLGNQGVYDAMFLPVIEILGFRSSIQPFKW